MLLNVSDSQQLNLILRIQVNLDRAWYEWFSTAFNLD